MASFQIPRFPSSREPKRGRAVGWVWVIRISLVLAAPLGMTKNRYRSVGAWVGGHGHWSGITDMADVVADIVEGDAQLIPGQDHHADRNGGQHDQEHRVLDDRLTRPAGQAGAPVHAPMTVRAGQRRTVGHLAHSTWHVVHPGVQPGLERLRARLRRTCGTQAVWSKTARGFT